MRSGTEKSFYSKLGSRRRYEQIQERTMAKMPVGNFVRLDVASEQVNTHYHERGKGDNVVIFVQTGGAATSAYMCWYANMDVFADAGYRVLAPDTVGFGLTERLSPAAEKGGISVPKFLIALMDKLGVDRAHFIGNSAGSMAITRLAIECPERVRSLILTGGEPRVETEQSRAIAATLGQTERMNFVREMLSKDRVIFDDMKRATSDFFYNPDHPRVNEVAAMRLETIERPGMLQKERLHASKQIERGRSNYQASDLSKIQAPTDLIHGRDEKFFFTRETAPILLDCAIKACVTIPNCDCTVLAQCGHWPQIEKADSFNALALEFLKSSVAS
jgi:2-hydroxy-6-oxonona-2,4-dienedioate hydrolase